jgi:hypothetical protein
MQWYKQVRLGLWQLLLLEHLLLVAVAMVVVVAVGLRVVALGPALGSLAHRIQQVQLLSLLLLLRRAAVEPMTEQT